MAARVLATWLAMASMDWVGAGTLQAASMRAARMIEVVFRRMSPPEQW
jgi:hypothetical protein